MSSKVFAGGAAILALSLVAGQAPAQQAPARQAAAGAAAEGNVGQGTVSQGNVSQGNVSQGIDETLAAGKVSTVPPPGADANGVTDASAGSQRQARHAKPTKGHGGNVVTSTLGQVPGLVGGTVGGAFHDGASAMGSAFGVGKPRSQAPPSSP
jgi:hypothetical protein